jgi:signal transduction histidine kinase
LQQPKELVAAAIIRARTDLEQALSDLERLPASDPSAVSFVAHSLNNYLTVTGATIDFLQLSLADHADPKIRVWLDNLQNASNLMTRAVNQLMNNAAITVVQFRFEKVNPSQALHSVCAFYQSKADQKRVRLVCGPFGEMPPVWTDRVAAGAVLDNLMSNALKYSPSGANMYLKAAAEQDSVVVTVCDEGPGLSQEEQAQLFQRGVRLSPEPTAGEPSAGYGLAVAKELVEQLGGTIWCTSEPGHGACFSFRLPFYQEQIHGPEPSLPGPQGGSANSGPTKPSN